MIEPKVLAVEYRMGAAISTGKVTSEVTLARVMTPLGEQWVEVPGYHAEQSMYAPLIEAAMSMAWWKFCNGC